MCRVDENEVSSNHDHNETEESPIADVGVDDGPTSNPSPVEVDDNAANDTDQKTPSSPTHYYRTLPSEYDSFSERWSVRVANRPCLHFWLSFLLSLGIGMVGLTVGDFSVSVDNAGWYSRGTLIADRHQQYLLVDTYREELYADEDGSVWDFLENERQVQVNTDDDDEDRRLVTVVEDPSIARPTEWNWETLGSQLQAGMQFLQGKRPVMSESLKEERRVAQDAQSQAWLVRRLQETESLGPLEGCNVEAYNSSSVFDEARLWPVYKNKNPTAISLWDAPALQEMCELEAVTQAYLENNNLCYGCGDTNRCLQPYSPVLFVRVTVQDGLTMSCADLAQAWEASYQSTTQEALVPCIETIKKDYNPDRNGATLPAGCPAYFFPHMLDEDATQNNMDVTHASAIYATRPDAIDEMYDNVDQFGYGSKYMDTYYDTQFEDLVTLATDAQILIDMSLAVGSAGITFLAMVIHTRSPFLALVGLLQIILSFPTGYFIYTFVARLSFFPFLNFIGIFVVFALGADDVFVSVDKWKNARLARPHAPPQEIAAKAFPDAAGAMLLTTLTTAVAFFGTAVCPVAPILCFAVFVGLLVVMDYVLCCLLVFPALVIYDNRMQAERRTGCCCHCGVHSCCCCFVKRRGSLEEGEENANNDDEDEEGSPSLIHRILDHYYKFLHRFRWPLLVACAAALAVCAVKAAQIKLPTSADVRLFDESDNQYEANYIQRKNLLFEVVDNKAGSNADVIWGVIPADTGNQNNPESWTKLVLDEDFDPSLEDVQVFLRDYCDRFFEQDFATPIRTGYQCAMERLDQWLADQAASDRPDDIYTEHCAGSTGLPIPQTNFDACAYAWSQAYNVDSMLARAGKITVITFRFGSRVRFDSPQDELDREWNLINDWMMNNEGPAGSGSPYYTSEDFWWYDTNAVMLETAYTGAGIAMAAAASVIFFSSRSFILTLFATVTVGYVLTSVTAVLVAMGWTLGFLESILFAILIGISCDFVIHLSHAYASLEGHTPRDERTRFALISMGPSILAAAFTTLAAAVVMAFTVITFFEKFATILFLTIAQSTVGSFVVFLVMVDSIGPSDPTYTVDSLLARCYRMCGKEYHVQGDEPTQHFTAKEFNDVDHRAED